MVKYKTAQKMEKNDQEIMFSDQTEFLSDNQHWDGSRQFLHRLQLALSARCRINLSNFFLPYIGGEKLDSKAI